MLRDRFGVFERRACAVVGQHRFTQRLEPPAPAMNEAWLRQWLRDFSRRRPRWGWRRAATELSRVGHRIDNKRIQRLWREEGLRVPYRKRKKPHRGIGTPVGASSPKPGPPDTNQRSHSSWTTHRGPLTCCSPGSRSFFRVDLHRHWPGGTSIRPPPGCVPIPRKVVHYCCI
jgi:hypothetical protein